LHSILDRNKFSLQHRCSACRPDRGGGGGESHQEVLEEQDRGQWSGREALKKGRKGGGAREGGLALSLDLS